MAIIYTSDILLRGLKSLGANEKSVSTSVSFATRISRFKSCFGAHPFIYASIWAELESIDKERNLERFFLFLFWLKNYPTEGVLAVRFNLGEETIRLWCWHYANCLAILSEDLIAMPQTFDPNIPFPMANSGPLSWTHLLEWMEPIVQFTSPCMTDSPWTKAIIPTNITVQDSTIKWLYQQRNKRYTLYMVLIQLELTMIRKCTASQVCNSICHRKTKERLLMVVILVQAWLFRTVDTTTKPPISTFEEFVQGWSVWWAFSRTFPYSLKLFGFGNNAPKSTPLFSVLLDASWPSR